MKTSCPVLSAVLILFAGVSQADPITPVINGIIAPTGLALPSLPIPDAPGGVPGLPTGLPSGLPTELPDLGSGGLPELPGLGGSGGGSSPLSPVTDLLLPGASDTDPITGALNGILTPRTGLELPALFAPLFNQFPFPGLPSVTNEVVALAGADVYTLAYGELNYRKGEVILAAQEPLNLILAMSTDPALYQAALLRASVHVQNALIGRPDPSGGGAPGLPPLPF
ncbi:MAG: hypothetical protein AABY95_03005 [Pseudomonadota bacterium]